MSHQIIASQMIEQIKSSLNNIHSSIPISMRDSIYTSLAWAGLSKTSPWVAKTNKIDYLQIMFPARDTSLGLNHSYGPYTIIGFPGIYTSSFTSLNLSMPCQ